MKKSFYIIILLSIFCNNISAQEIIIDTTNIAFVQLQKNHLEIPQGSDSALINAFFQKLSNLQQYKEGNINIVHIGGSHVQGGYFSDKIRRDFDFFNEDLQSSRGLIFPYKAAKTNNPSNFSVRYSGEWSAERNVKRSYSMPLGAAGIAAATEDKNAEISIALNTDKSLRWTFDTLVLIGQSIVPDKVSPLLRGNDTTLIEGVFDETSHTYTFILPEKTDSFTVVFRQNDSVPNRFVLGGFLPKNSSQGIVYHDIGVNGAAVFSYLNCENFEQELTLLKPDLMIFGIGINDAVDKNFSAANFINNYNKLLQKIKNISPDCAFIFITNNDSYRNSWQVYYRKNKRRYRTVSTVNTNGAIAEAAFYEIARQNGGAVWNQFAIMGGLTSMKEWQNANLAARDKIHFTKSGYELLGNLFFNAILEYSNLLNFQQED
ncbi:MAG: GDSL-type esterase/lipase family protein [Prevotellaceae bacterium]|jgi:hypothetical protein|nr:GDSL-type esterase/lipase family protein [Prevotellaceae bacterium]